MALLTLWLLSVLIFAGGHLLPGNVGRAMLGPFADQTAVDVLNHEMGTDRPVLVQYADWISGFVTGDTRQPTLLCPAAVAVHNNCDVRRETGGVEGQCQFPCWITCLQGVE